MYFYLSIFADLSTLDPDIIAYKTIEGALLVRKDIEVGKEFHVYKIEDATKVVDTENVDQVDMFMARVSGKVIIRNQVLLKRMAKLKITSLKEIQTFTNKREDSELLDVQKLSIWNFELDNTEPSVLLECAVSEAIMVNTLYELERDNLVISESLSGALLIIIPKLIKLILIIVSKIAYLLAVPLVNALINNTKNIRKTGEAVVTGSSSVGEVAQSIDYSSLRNAVVSASKGDVAGFVVQLDESLSKVNTDEKKAFRDDMEQDKQIYKNIGDHNKELFSIINEKVKTELKITRLINEKEIDLLMNSLEMLKDENLIHTEMNYIVGMNDTLLSDMEHKNRRYDLKFMEGYVDKVRYLVEMLQKGDSIELVDEVRHDTSDSKKIFSSYYLDCVAKLVQFKEYLPPELFSHHFYINSEAKVVSNLKATGDAGDFNWLKVNRKIQRKTVLDILKECNDNLDDLNAMTIRSFGFYAGHIGNHNDSEEIKKRKENIDTQLKDMQDVVSRLTPDAIGYGLEHSYITALLDFLRVDLINIMNTIKTSKKYFLDNHENMMDVVSTLTDEIVGTYFMLILNDIIRNPNIYKATDTALATVVALYKERGGTV